VAASATLILGVVGLSVTAVVYLSHQGILKQEQLAKLEATAEEQQQIVTDAVRRLREDVQFLSGTPPIAGIAAARAQAGRGLHAGDSEAVWSARLETIFLAFIRRRPEYVQVRLIGLDAGANELVRIDRATANLILPVRGDALQRKSDANYVRAARTLGPGSVYISEVNLNREYDHVTLPPTPVIRAVTPVFTSEGEAYGLIVINQDLSNMFDSLERGRPHGAGLYLTDQKGNYLVNTETGLAFGFDFGRPRRLQDDLPETAEFYAAQSGEDRGLFDFKRRDQERVREYALSMTKIRFDPAHPERALVLGLSASYDELLGDSRMVGRRSAWAAVSLILAGSIAVLIQMRRLLSPLGLVAASTNRVAAGDYEVDLPLDAAGEIGQLASSFRSMVQQVEERNRTLEDRAREIEGQQAVLRAKNAELEEARGEREARAAQIARARQHKSEFLARIFHDVRAPVNNIVLLAKGLAENVADNLRPDQTEAAQVLAGVGADLLEIINDLLDLSKIEAGKLEIRKERTNLAVLVRQVCLQFAPMAEGKSILLDCSVDEEVPETIVTDPRRLRQILWNLVSNAIKYTAAGSVTLSARLDGTGVAIEVADTGAGIAEEDLERIFTPYERLEREVRSDKIGTGLGLAIVQELASALGAALSVDSRLAEGSRFVLHLPLPATAGKMFASARILIADDDAATRFVLERQFRKRDRETVLEIVQDGLSALEAIRARAFDCAIVDLHLPMASGLEILRSLDVDRPASMPRMLLYSGSDPLPRERAEAERLGATVIIKEGDPESLERLAELAIGGSRARALSGC
jgi:signal transduction histidine kinase